MKQEVLNGKRLRRGSDKKCTVRALRKKKSHKRGPDLPTDKLV